MNRKRVCLAIFFLFLPFALAGCASQMGAHELIEKAVNASKELDSYQFDGKLELSIETDAAELGQNALTEMLKNIELEVDGVYQREPLQTELNMDVALGGLSLDIPLIMTEKKMWVQIPALPIPQMPQEMVGKYIQIDLEQMEDDPMLEQSPVGIQSLDMETQQKLGMEIMQIFVSHYDEETYFQVLDAEEAGLAEDVDVEQVVRFTLSEDQVEPAISTFIQGVLPDLHELLSEPEWSEALELTEEDLNEMADEIEKAQAKEEEALQELGESLKLEQLKLEFGVNGDDQISYQKINIAADVKDEESEDWTSISMMLEIYLDGINEEQEFEHGVPSEEDTITYEQLIPMFIGPSFQ